MSRFFKLIHGGNMWERNGYLSNLTLPPEHSSVCKHPHGTSMHLQLFTVLKTYYLTQMQFRNCNGPSPSNKGHSLMTGAFFDLKNLAAYQKEESDQLHENQEHLNVLCDGQPSEWLNLLEHVKLCQEIRGQEKWPIPNHSLATCMNCLDLKAGLKGLSAKLEPLPFRSCVGNINQCFSKILPIKLRCIS